MKLLFFSLVIVLLAAIIAVAAHKDPGYLLINYHGWVIESSVLFALTILVVLFVVFYISLRFLVQTRHMPQRLQQWQQQRHISQAGESLTSGLIELASGNWSKAEKKLLRHVEHSQSPLLNYLGAARAAQKRGDEERRDYYLRQAHETTPAAELAIGLTQADLQLSQGQLEQALATLSHLRQLAPKHALVIKLLLRLYNKLHDWDRLLEIVPLAVKYKVIDKQQAQHCSATAYAALLLLAAEVHASEVLEQCWQRVPKALRQEHQVLRAYVDGLLQLQQGAVAEKMLVQALSHTWHDDLIYLYGFLPDTDINRQIRYAESWLSDHRQDAGLLLTLGRLCRRRQLWAQARQYFEASAAIEPRSETFAELAQLLEQQGEQLQALTYYRQALQQLPGAPVRPMLDKP